MITLIGLGPGDSDGLSRGAERALKTAHKATEDGSGLLLLRTERHPAVEWLRAENLKFTTFDHIYDSAPNFAAVYTTIAQTVLDAASTIAPTTGKPLEIAYAVPGHPLFGEESVRQIREEAERLGIATRIVSSGSFVEASLTAVGADLNAGCDIRDALTLEALDILDRTGHRTATRLDVTRGLLLFQVYDRSSASHAKLALMRDYPDDWEIVIVRAAGIPGVEELKRVPLYRLDREKVDHLTSVYIPPLPPDLRRPGFSELVGLMARLRAPDGCPWDKEQTHTSLKRFFVEETYEVLDAIDSYVAGGDPDLFQEELGDALLQVVFHAQLTAEEGIFTIDDVCRGIVEKLVRRHPHVFGTTEVADSEEVLRNWELIKRSEKTPDQEGYRKSILDGIPRELPALMRAMEVSKKVVKVGFEWNSFADVLAKMEEELRELRAELSRPEVDQERVAAELGDLLFTLVQVARWQKIDPEEALRRMLKRFTGRFQYIERAALQQSRQLTDLTLEEMDALWNEAKRETQGQ